MPKRKNVAPNGTCSFTPSTVAEGGTVAFTGSGFVPNTSTGYYIRFPNGALGVGFVDVKADGTFSETMTADEGVGPYNLNWSVEQGARGCSFTATP